MMGIPREKFSCNSIHCLRFVYLQVSGTRRSRNRPPRLRGVRTYFKCHVASFPLSHVLDSVHHGDDLWNQRRSIPKRPLGGGSASFAFS